MITESWIGKHKKAKKVKTMMDYGAATNTITEEIVVQKINEARRMGIKPGDVRHPIARLEAWRTKESVSGVLSARPLEMLGAAVLRVDLPEPGQTEKTRMVEVRAKIFPEGKSDFDGMIWGGRTLDTARRGGMGLQVNDNSFTLQRWGTVLPRVERKAAHPRQGKVFGPIATSVSVLSQARASKVDSDCESSVASEEEQEAGKVHAACSRV